MNELAVKFIGSEEWKDHLYDSGLYFMPQQTRLVPFLVARKLLQHIDLFEQGVLDDVADDDTADLTEAAQVVKQAQDDALNETFDVFNSVAQMDKNALAAFAKQHFNQDLNKKKSVETLRDEVRGLIDQFGLA
ncbi:hypothetical protein [Wielerella bovis]|uniref:hypothetical protein n=1 Tax=Wielerella bovis TaxID=2917790 RepID=UPI002018CA85|nr:hypothetical protein [Wielerella bovis]ULJ66646.1 hypothetical protein MIS31_10415 [Wielerella bovis]